MKKFILILCVAVTLCWSSVCYADIDVDIEGGEFESFYDDIYKYRENEDIVWSGKEWITKKYPPQVSTDGVNFTEVAGSDEVKAVLGSRVYTYYWTGSDYILYQPIEKHDHIFYQTDKYVYRVSADMQTLLDTYTIPRKEWVNSLVYKDGKYYILTETVMPVFAANNSDRVMGVSYQNFCLYESVDLYEWTEADLPFEFPTFDIRPTLEKINDAAIVVNYKSGNRSVRDYSDKPITNLGVITNGSIYEVDFERFDGKSVGICGEYFYSEIYDPENDLEQLAFSKDGVYWEYAGMSDIRYIINVYEKNDNIIVRFFNDTETGPGANLSFIDKNSLYSQLENNLSDTNVYVRLNDKILGFDQPPVTENDRTLVPMRFLFEQMGAEVTWDDATQTATATVPVTTEEEIQTFGLAEEKSVTFSVDNTMATVNGSAATMDVPARLINDKTMVPLRFLSENLGFNVQWDEATRTAIVTTE